MRIDESPRAVDNSTQRAGKPSWVGYASDLWFAGLCCLVGYLEKVFNAEDSRDAVGAHERNILVRLAINDAVEFHVALLDRDADGLCRVNSVPAKGGISI